MSTPFEAIAMLCLSMNSGIASLRSSSALIVYCTGKASNKHFLSINCHQTRIHSSTRSVKQFPSSSTIFAVKPRPPAQVTGCPFLIKAAELKRFRSHPLRMYTLSIQRWVGGRSSKLRAESLLTKMATARLYTLTLPPTGTCQIVQFTPLRSVYHHNLCSEAPPARPGDWMPLFDKSC